MAIVEQIWSFSFGTSTSGEVWESPVPRRSFGLPKTREPLSLLGFGVLSDVRGFVMLDSCVLLACRSVWCYELWYGGACVGLYSPEDMAVSVHRVHDEHIITGLCSLSLFFGGIAGEVWLGRCRSILPDLGPRDCVY